MHPPVLILLFSVLLLPGCSQGTTTVLDPVSHDPGQDHWAYASYYTREATISRQQDEEMASQAVVYEWLLGRGSDWMAGRIGRKL